MSAEQRARSWLYVFLAVVGFLVPAILVGLFGQATWPVSAGLGLTGATALCAVGAVLTGDIQRIGLWLRAQSARTKSILTGVTGFVIALLGLLWFYTPVIPAVAVSIIVGVFWYSIFRIFIFKG